MAQFSANEREMLLKAAHDSIEQMLTTHRAMTIDLAKYPAHLQQNGACFVTLHLLDQLRGCIGSLIAHQPLIVDIIQNAYNAAFSDPRFMPVTLNEWPKVTLEISVLSKPQAMHFASEADLIQQLRPGIDGLIISDHGNRGTFLPSVWEQLPDPAVFLQHLKHKAGLPTDYWSNTLTVENYTAELIS